VVVAPVGIGVLRGRPLFAFGLDLALTPAPVLLRHGLPFALGGGGVDGAGAGEVAAGEPGALVALVVGQHAAVAAVDRHQHAAVVAVAVALVADQVRLVGARLVVVVAVGAVRQRLGDAHRAVVALPDPRPLAVLVVEGVVRGRIAEAGVHLAGA